MTAALVVLAFAIGLALFAVGLKDWIRGTAALHWQTVPGRMLKASLGEKIVIGGRTRFRQHILIVECEFEVDGQRVICRQLTPFPGDPAFGRRDEAEALLTRFAPGNVVDVHVHPSDPQRSVLLPSASTRMPHHRNLMVAGVLVYLTAGTIGFWVLR
jgi:hypothetical protein